MEPTCGDTGQSMDSTGKVIAPSEGHFRHSYSLGDEIGKGAYAIVFRCTHRETKAVYAVKIVDKRKAAPKDIDDITHEIGVMGRIGYHPHVVQMIEYFATERHLYIILDLLSGGMLFDRIIERKHYSESTASVLVRNVLSGLAHVHSKGIMHRDLKPENLLLRYEASPSTSPNSNLTDVCLADFGLAGYVSSTTCCGSPSYIAPEVIAAGYYRSRKEPYDAKCDVWSMGVITYILLSGKMPFHGNTITETFDLIVSNRWSFSSDTWASVTSTAKDFIRACLTYDPVARPTALALLQHPWLANEQPHVHLGQSLESLRDLTKTKVKAAVRVFCWTQSLLGPLDWTPPFMRFLRHPDKFSTVLTHQSQTDPQQAHTVDFSKALAHGRPGWRIQDCCTCPSDKVCRHIQNVHEYLFVGKRSLEVYPFIDQLRMMREEAEDSLTSNPCDAETRRQLDRVNYVIEAACVFSDELAKVPAGELKPNLMLDGSRNTLFRALGGSRSVTKTWEDAEKEDATHRVVGKMSTRKSALPVARKTTKGVTTPPSSAVPLKPSSKPSSKRSSMSKRVTTTPKVGTSSTRS
ncbi:protein kinase, putative [Leishmania tarentolae]|uniref:Protein kinase, putative n=1 Tax=Leishmania tarentolae TaxID=5689 RepID=A0A640KLL1_LEITA|nr:protein kinase, putative [Leishmania tarentolae]